LQCFVLVNCWPSVSGGESYVNIEYEASRAFELQNVVIHIPLPALHDVPTVNQVDGEWRLVGCHSDELSRKLLGVLCRRLYKY
jgi:hypothetical protein